MSVTSRHDVGYYCYITSIHYCRLIKHKYINSLVISVLIASVPGHCLPFSYYQNILQEILLCMLVLSTVGSSISVPLDELHTQRYFGAELSTVHLL